MDKTSNFGFSSSRSVHSLYMWCVCISVWPSASTHLVWCICRWGFQVLAFTVYFVWDGVSLLFTGFLFTRLAGLAFWETCLSLPLISPWLWDYIRVPPHWIWVLNLGLNICEASPLPTEPSACLRELSNVPHIKVPFYAPPLIPSLDNVGDWISTTF